MPTRWAGTSRPTRQSPSRLPAAPGPAIRFHQKTGSPGAGGKPVLLICKSSTLQSVFPTAQLPIEDDQSGGGVIDFFQQLDDMAERGFFFNLFADEPAEEILGRQILFFPDQK